MTRVTKNHPTTAAHDYLPAAGRDAFLRFYDPLTALLGAARVHRTLINQAALAPGQRVLEIGCGTGNLAIRLKRTHPDVEVIGSDPDPLAIARAQRKASGIRFERAYAQRLPYPDGSFDRVLSSLMLHHLDEETKIATAAEIQRVLRPGGSLHIVDFTGETHGIHGMLARRIFRSGHTADHHDGIPRLLNAAGLECDKLAVRQIGILGRAGYYRAVRKANQQ